MTEPVRKRIRLARARAGADPQRFQHDWRRAVEELMDRAQPDAAAVGFALDDADERYAGVSMAWFADEAHLHAAPDDESLPTAGEVIGLTVDEEIVRGAEWLGARSTSDEWYLHMALTPRAPGLTRAEFARRWRDHARGSANPLPDEIRGLAYVQNHPRGEAPPYDAVNEAHFDDLDGLRHRVDWFREHGIGAEPDELFGVAAFLALRVERLC
ncbi:MAG: EthD domain-containing protein [Acidimicrobiales bacterium]|nr:EthD domain-containing protein [Acidimicrobiales bacterium]